MHKEDDLEEFKDLGWEFQKRDSGYARFDLIVNHTIPIYGWSFKSDRMEDFYYTSAIKGSDDYDDFYFNKSDLIYEEAEETANQSGDIAEMIDFLDYLKRSLREQIIINNLFDNKEKKDFSKIVKNCIE